ncbi:MAG: ABC transporter transmembrane domain-containing protein, partial [Finegoldia magna]|nr:ABC transporter transmembrane domain-containing protein [Finegoldia magna]
MRKSVTNRIIKYSLNEKKNLTIGMVFTVLMTVFEIIGPIILAYIINNLLTGEKLVYNIRKLALVLSLYAAVFFVDSLWKYNSTVYLEKTANKIARRMQMDVYDHIQKMPISFYDNLPAGKVVSRITNDTKTVKSFYQMVLAQLMVSVI